MTNEIHDVHADLQPLLTEIGPLGHLENNPNIGDIDAVAKSFDRFGQRKPIIVKKTNNEVIAGNTSLQAMRKLGWTHCAALFVEETDTESKAYALADNRTAELSETDPYNLATIIDEIKEIDQTLLEAASYSFEDIDAMLDAALQEFDYDMENDGELKSATPMDDNPPQGFKVVVLLDSLEDREEFLILMRQEQYRAFPKD